MSEKRKKATLYLDADLHRALRIKAAETERSMSELVSDAVRRSLGEDAVDLAAFEDRAGESNLRIEDLVRELRRDGRI